MTQVIGAAVGGTLAFLVLMFVILLLVLVIKRNKW